MKYEDSDIPNLNNAIGDFPFEDILVDFENADYAAECWTHLLLQIAREYIPCKTVKIHPQDKKWINKDIKATIKTRDRLYNRYRRTKQDHHYHSYLRVKAEVNIKISRAKEEHKNKLIAKLEDLQHSPRTFWTVAKEVHGNKAKSTIPTMVDNGKQHSTAETKAELLAAYFASQSQKPTLPADYIKPPHVHTAGIDNLHITEEEVLSVLRKLKTNSAPGPDGISNRLLKLTACSITPSLTMLFNKVISLSTFPKIWKEANVTPIFKKDDQQNKKNYRPVSLLSTVGKVLERIIFNKLYSYCENNGYLTWRNSGYKKKDSTIHQLTYIVNNIYKNLDNKQENCLVFLDQSKAFDRIFHDRLKQKLSALGINGTLYQLLSNYLHRVPQGSILDPLLFLIYINDIIDNIDCDIFLYAHDKC